jgi:hypothetical protein
MSAASSSWTVVPEQVIERAQREGSHRQDCIGRAVTEYVDHHPVRVCLLNQDFGNRMMGKTGAGLLWMNARARRSDFHWPGWGRC